MKKGSVRMELDWLGKHRGIVGDFYRSANGYSQICKEEFLGEEVRFSPYEVQIMEHIMEHEQDNRNMKWFARELGLTQATYSRYVGKLVRKGLVEKYHTEDNRKNIILRVSDLGLKEYRLYAGHMKRVRFEPMLEYLDGLTPEQLEAVEKVMAFWGTFHNNSIRICRIKEQRNTDT